MRQIKSWTDEEVALLRKLDEKHGGDLELVARELKRTEKSCAWKLTTIRPVKKRGPLPGRGCARVAQEQIDDMRERQALRNSQSITSAFFGDPLPGRSALDRRGASQ